MGFAFTGFPPCGFLWDFILLSDKALIFCLGLELPEIILKEEKGRKERHKGNHSAALYTRGHGLMQYTQKRIVPYLLNYTKQKSA